MLFFASQQADPGNVSSVEVCSIGGLQAVVGEAWGASAVAEVLLAAAPVELHVVSSFPLAHPPF